MLLHMTLNHLLIFYATKVLIPFNCLVTFLIQFGVLDVIGGACFGVTVARWDMNKGI